jgi:hypothetical protein
MIAAQLLAAHNAAMECHRRAMLGEQTFEGRRENLSQANKLSRTYAVLLDALNRHRGTLPDFVRWCEKLRRVQVPAGPRLERQNLREIQLTTEEAMAPTYESALRDYRQAIDDLRKPSTAAERGSRGIAETASDAELDRVVKSSEDLRAVLSSAAASQDPDVRDIVGLKLLAAAATDLAVAEQMINASARGEGVVERSGEVVLNQPELAAILDAPLDATGMVSLSKTVVRAALPGEPRAAGKKLCEMAEQLIADVSELSLNLGDGRGQAAAA